MRNFDLVIFDMDGTLVDSEMMASEAMTQALFRNYKYEMSAQELADRYRGWAIDPVLADLSEVCGVRITHDFLADADHTYHELIESSLRPTTGVNACLESLREHIAVSIASNSSRDILEHYIQHLKWDSLFDMKRNVFSAQDVTKGKPSPELFLLAAERLNVEPRRCIVLEDSATGASGAIAAGMTVIGFTGNHPESMAHLNELQIDIIDDMAAFPKLALQ